MPNLRLQQTTRGGDPARQIATITVTTILRLQAGGAGATTTRGTQNVTTATRSGLGTMTETETATATMTDRGTETGTTAGVGTRTGTLSKSRRPKSESALPFNAKSFSDRTQHSTLPRTDTSTTAKLRKNGARAKPPAKPKSSPTRPSSYPKKRAKPPPKSRSTRRRTTRSTMPTWETSLSGARSAKRNARWG